jgi:hypothetical protein
MANAWRAEVHNLVSLLNSDGLQSLYDPLNARFFLSSTAKDFITESKTTSMPLRPNWLNLCLGHCS